jgi:hypothetical protein
MGATTKISADDPSPAGRLFDQATARAPSKRYARLCKRVLTQRGAIRCAPLIFQPALSLPVGSARGCPPATAVPT